MFRTKGDNNDAADPWTFTLDDGDGALEKAHIPYLGWIYLALGVPWVRILLITVPALLIIVFTAVSLWREAGREVEEAQRRRMRRPRGVNPPGAGMTGRIVAGAAIAAAAADRGPGGVRLLLRHEDEPAADQRRRRR